MTPAGLVMIRSFLPSGHAVYCMLCCACFCFVLPSSQFPILSCQVPLKMEAIGTWKPEEQLLSYPMDHLGP